MAASEDFYANVRAGIKAAVVIVALFFAFLFGYHAVDGKAVGCPSGQAEVNTGVGSACYPIVSINVNS